MLKVPRAVIVLAAMLSVGSTDAGAFGAVGTIWTGNSWGQRFEQVADHEFDTLRIDWLYGATFELPTVFENFSADGWSASWEFHNAASARGTGQNILEFDIIFDGDIEPTGFSFATYRQGEHREFFRAEYEGHHEWGRWNICQDNSEPPPPDPPDPPDVPEPATLILVGAGLAALRLAHSRQIRG